MSLRLAQFTKSGSSSVWITPRRLVRPAPPLSVRAHVAPKGLRRIHTARHLSVPCLCLCLSPIASHKVERGVVRCFTVGPCTRQPPPTPTHALGSRPSHNRFAQSEYPRFFGRAAWASPSPPSRFCSLLAGQRELRLDPAVVLTPAGSSPPIFWEIRRFAASICLPRATRGYAPVWATRAGPPWDRPVRSTPERTHQPLTRRKG